MAQKPKSDTRSLVQGTLDFALKGDLDPDELRSLVEAAIAGAEPAAPERGKFSAGTVDRLLRGKPFTPKRDSPYLCLDHPRPNVGYWFFRYKGKRTDIGLAYGDDKLTPDEARAIRDRMLQAAKEGRDPKEEKRRPEPQQSPPQTDKPTNATNSYNAVWATYRERYYANTVSVDKRDRWHDKYIKPVIGNMDVAKITDAEVDRIVKPIFEEVEPEPPSTVGLVDAARLIGKSTTAIHEALHRRKDDPKRLPFILDERTGKRRFEISDLERVFSVTIADDGKRTKLGPHVREGHGARTGMRVLFQIAAVLDFATSYGMRKGDNPARWKGLFEHRYKADDTPEGHFAALPWHAVPELIVNLHAVPEKHWHHIPKVLAQLAEAHVLAASGRCRALREARWPWVDWKTCILDIPAAFMKMRRRFRLPLSPRMMAILRERYADRRDTDNGLIFPEREAAPSGNCRQKRRPLKTARPFRPQVVLKLIKACSPPGVIPKTDTAEILSLDSGEPIQISVEDTEESLEATSHGLRSSFREFGSEHEYPDHLLELCLTHDTASKVKRAYQRSDYLNSRRKIMDHWDSHCCSLPDDSFVLPAEKLHVREDQAVIDEGWRLLLSGKAANRQRAAQMAFNRIPGATSVGSVYQYMWAHPHPDAPAVKEHIPYGDSKPFVEQARNLLLTNTATTICEAANIAEQNSGGTVARRTIERMLRKQPDLKRFIVPGRGGRRPASDPAPSTVYWRGWRDKRKANAAD